MSVALSIHAPWVRNTVRFVGALSIPAVLIGFFYYSKTMADREYKTTASKLTSDKTANQTQVDNYELKEVDDSNQVKWMLLATKGATEDNKKYDLVNVHMKYYDGPNVKMQISAPTGKVDSDTKFTTLYSDKSHRVKGDSDDGKSIFESDTVELDKNNKFFATGNVIIEWANDARVTGNEARGKLDKDGLKEVKVHGHTHALVQVKETPEEPQKKS